MLTSPPSRSTCASDDATIVRLVLVPATMTLLGRANWWLPDWLERILPHIDAERTGPVAAR
jgi:RND superfamily putative drug exporter